MGCVMCVCVCGGGGLYTHAEQVGAHFERSTEPMGAVMRSSIWPQQVWKVTCGDGSAHVSTGQYQGTEVLTAVFDRGQHLAAAGLEGHLLGRQRTCEYWTVPGYSMLRRSATTSV
jgi:hypothetical protein